MAEVVRFDIMREGDEVVVREDGAVAAVEASSEIAFDLLFKRIQKRSFAALPDDIRIHAASGIYEGRMFLLVGQPHAGKTTLAMRLLEAGMRVTGDEMVLLRNGRAIAYPRKFYPRASSFDLLPGLAASMPGLPLVYDGDGSKRLAVDPSALGRPWRLERLPVGTIFFLDPDFGMPSRSRPLAKVEMVRLVMEQSLPPASGRKDWIADLCGTTNAAKTVLLSVGDLDSALTEVRSYL